LAVLTSSFINNHVLSTDQYLTHYWPITNGKMNDVIGSSDMIQGSLTNFTFDRFYNLNSALALNGGWTRVPSGIYFDTPEFTISVWIYPQQVGYGSRILDFGNGPSADNIVLAISLKDSLKDYFQIFSGTAQIFLEQSPQNLTLNKWQFLTFTFNGTNAYIYLNGTLTTKSNQNFTLSILNRTNCLIGKSNWATDKYSSSYLDDLRFYNKSLTQTEILELMNQSQISNLKN